MTHTVEHIDGSVVASYNPDCGLSERAALIVARSAVLAHLDVLGAEFPKDRVDEAARALLELIFASIDGPARNYDRVAANAEWCRARLERYIEEYGPESDQARNMAVRAHLGEQTLEERPLYREVPDAVTADHLPIVDRALALEAADAPDPYARLAAADVRALGVIPMLTLEPPQNCT